MAGGLIDLNTELTQVLNGDPTVRAIDRDRARKKAWMKDLIRIQRLDDDGRLQKGCEWRIARRRLTQSYLQGLVDKCPLPCNIDCFVDNNGTSFTFNEIQVKAQSDPFTYVIIPKVVRKPVDIYEDPKYSGQTVFMIKFVPIHAVDGKTPVDAASLREWILAAIAEIDPVSGRIYQEMEDIKVRIQQVDTKIRYVPTLDIRDKTGKKLPDEKADEERQILYVAYGEEKMRIMEELKEKEVDLEEHVKWRTTIGMDILKIDTDPLSQTALWQVSFYGHEDVEEIEDMLMEKTDWQEIRLSVGNKEMGLSPWAGHDPVPDGTNIEQPNHKPYLVDIHEARIVRVAHGTGTYRELENRKSSALHGEKFELYYGDWDRGRKSGHGISVSDLGLFTGRHVDGMRRGKGTLDLANGTSISAYFGVQLQHMCDFEGMFENPYLQGEPQGETEIMFADGAIYKGNMVNGKIAGTGEYQSAFGEIMKGEFLNGVLHGDDCFLRNHAGEEFRGRFVHGELHGKGSYKNKYGGSYEGYWRYGMRYGRGVEKQRGKHSFIGYFINDVRCGKSRTEFGRKRGSRKTDANKAASSMDGAGAGNDKKYKNNMNESVEAVDEGDATNVYSAVQSLSKFKQIYEGFFVANKPTVRG